MGDFRRREGESNEQYQVRLTLMKQGGADLSWEDISEMVGDGRFPESYRKDSYGIRRYHMASSEESSLDNEVLLEIKKEKVKLADMRSEANRQIRNLARVENIVDLLRDSINELIEDKPFLNDYSYIRTASGKDGILILSDWHYGMTVDNHINTYNTDICCARLTRVIDKAIENGKANNIDKLFVVLNGDLISGELHSSIKLSNAETLTQQIVRVSEIISECLHRLSEHFFVTVVMNNGNHEAVEMIKDDRSNKNNYSMIMNEMVKVRTITLNNVVFIQPVNNGEMSIFRVKDLTVASCHGDQVSLNKCKEQMEMVLGHKLDLILLGHYHQPKMLSQYDTEVYVNGSLVSTDDYAMKKKLYNPPSQTMLIVSDEGVECSYIIKC